MGNPVFAAAEAHLISMLMGGDSWDYSEMTAQSNKATSAQSYTHLNVTGSGVLTTFYAASGGAFAVSVDGQTPFAVIGLGNHGVLYIPFKTSLVVTSGTAPSTSHFVSGVLDGSDPKWSAKTLITSMPTTSNPLYANTWLNITGSGIFTAALWSTTASYSARIEVDGVRYDFFRNNTAAQLYLHWPFTTSFKFTSDYADTSAYVHYALD